MNEAHTHDWQVYKTGWKCNICKDTLDTNEQDTIGV